MTFATVFRHPKTLPYDLGSDVEVDYRLAINSRGVKELMKTGTHSIQDRIQSFHDSVEINNVVERCILTEDYSSLQLDRLTDTYTDMTVMPKTLREVRQIYNDGMCAFMSLPDDERSKYESFERFLDSFESISVPAPELDSVPVPKEAKSE